VLRARLSTLFEADVYLTGMAAAATLGNHNPPAALAAVDHKTQELAAAVGDAYPSIQSQFLTLWRQETSLFMDYAAAKAAGDTAKATATRAALDTFRKNVGALFNGVNPNLTQDSVVTLLSGHVSTIESTIDAQARHDNTQYADLKAAADQMPEVGEFLAKGFALAMKSRYTGNVDSRAALLVTTLEDVLQAHTYMVGVAATATIDGGDAQAAANAVDANSSDLANVFTSVYDPTVGTRLLASWRQQVARYRDYTAARVQGAAGAAAATQAAGQLSQYPQSLGSFLAGLQPPLDVSGVVGSLGSEVSALLAAVDAEAGHDPRSYDLVRTAADQMLPLGAALADAVATQFPGTFTAT